MLFGVVCGVTARTAQCSNNSPDCKMPPPSIVLFRFLMLSLGLRAFQEGCKYIAIRHMLSWQDLGGRDAAAYCSLLDGSVGIVPSSLDKF